LPASVWEAAPTVPPSPAQSNAAHARRATGTTWTAVRVPTGLPDGGHGSGRKGADSTSAERTGGIFTGRTVRLKGFGFS